MDVTHRYNTVRGMNIMNIMNIESQWWLLKLSEPCCFVEN
jgi:hypothetical protein